MVVLGITETDMADVTTDLPAADEEVQRGHPFLVAKACLSSKVMQVRNKSRHEVGQAPVIALRVDPDRVRCDIVDGQIEERRPNLLPSGSRFVGHFDDVKASGRDVMRLLMCQCCFPPISTCVDSHRG